MYSPVVSNGETMGDGAPSALETVPGMRGLDIRNGEEGGGGPRPGDGCRRGEPELKPWRCRLFRLRSRQLVARLRVCSGGDSVRQFPNKPDEIKLLSLSLASLSRYMELRIVDGCGWPSRPLR